MRPLEWSDFTPKVRENTIVAIMRVCHLPYDEAEEVVCSAMAKLMQQPRLTRNPPGLLFATAKNLLRSEHAAKANQPVLAELVRRLDESEAAGNEPADHRADHVSELMNNEDTHVRVAQVGRGLARLLPADRAILIAYYLDGKSPKAMDEERDDTPGTAKLRLHRARKRLIKLMNVVAKDGGAER